MAKVTFDNLVSGELICPLGTKKYLLRISHNGKLFEHCYEEKRPTVSQLINAISEMKIPHGPSGGALLKFARRLHDHQDHSHSDL